MHSAHVTTGVVTITIAGAAFDCTGFVGIFDPVPRQEEHPERSGWLRRRQAPPRGRPREPGRRHPARWPMALLAFRRC